MLTFIINFLGVLFIFFVIAWFWYKQKQKLNPSQYTGPIEIIVADGIYQPDTIVVPTNQPIELHFYRKDDTPCAGMVIFEQLKISQDLPLNQKQILKLKINEPGEYTFTCQMGMYHGRLIARD